MIMIQAKPATKIENHPLLVLSPCGTDVTDITKVRCERRRGERKRKREREKERERERERERGDY